MRRRVSRSSALVLASLCALLIGAQPVAASTLLVHSGSIGTYSQQDLATPSGHQAVICTYDPTTFKLTGISVRHPQVKARNRTSGHDTQTVGWQFIVQHQAPSGTTWQTLAGSSFAKAVASDTSAAAFTDRTWVAPADPTGKYRIVVAIRWYTPGSTSTVQGYVKLLDSNYESKAGPNAAIYQGYCLQDY